MKRTITTAFLALAFIAGVRAQTTKNVNVGESSITWTGKKVLGQHTGTIDLKSGQLQMQGDRLVGGTFIVDMTTIAVKDLQAGKGKEKLEGHLNSADFFDTATYPEATFTITEATASGDGYSVEGNFTIKGKTVANKVKMTLAGNTLTSTFELDRTKYDVRYGSTSFFDNLKDNAISDTFELVVNLRF